MRKILFFIALFCTSNIMAQITIEPTRQINNLGTLSNRLPSITSRTPFSVGISSGLNFSTGGSYNVGLGTYGTLDGILIANANTSPSFNNNHGKFHIWHSSTAGASQTSQYSAWTGGPQLLLDQNELYRPYGGPPLDFYSRIHFRTSAVTSIGNTRYLKTGNVWEIKAKSYNYAYPFIQDNPGYEHEDFIIRHSIGGDAITVTGNSNTTHHGFTKLGNEPNTPFVKIVMVTGTIANANFTLLAHGITDPLKIVAINVLVENTSTNIIPPSYTINPGYHYDYDINGANIVITPNPSSLTNLQGKPIKILITYLE